MSNQVLGHCACPLCGCPNQEVKESNAKSPKPYLNCEECGVQIFTRQSKSVRILKQKIVVLESDHMYDDSEGDKVVKKTAAPVAVAKPIPVETAKPVAPAKPVEAVSSTKPVEKTIFDWLG